MENPAKQVGWRSTNLLLTTELTSNEFKGLFWDDRCETWISCFITFDEPCKPRLSEHLAQITGIPSVAGSSGESKGVPLSTDSSEADSRKDPVYRSPNGNSFILNKRGTIW